MRKLVSTFFATAIMLGAFAQTEYLQIFQKDGQISSFHKANVEKVNVGGDIVTVELKSETNPKTYSIANISSMEMSNQNLVNEYVDLGLPSGTFWATCNVGATKPEEYGSYFAWGEISSKDSYDWDNYLFGKKDVSDEMNYGMTKYNGTDNKKTIDLEDDAARVNWGGKWRMPTFTEMQELKDNCTWTQITLNGVSGVEVKSNTNGNSIFLPIAGYRDGSTTYINMGMGHYLTSSLVGDSPNPDIVFQPYYACYLFLCSSSNIVIDFYDTERYLGYSVRPVYSPLPEVGAVKIFEITPNSAMVSGKILLQGASELTERGVVYGISENPTTETAQKVIAETDNFELTLESLESSKTYYVRAFATNSFGTSYGEEKTFTTNENQ